MKPRAANTREAPAAGALVANIMHFARCLRHAGLPIGPAQVLHAVQALAATGIGTRQDFYWALHAVFVNRVEQHRVFDQAFHVYWRNPKFLARLNALLLPQVRLPTENDIAINRRLAEAMLSGTHAPPPSNPCAPQETEFNASLTWSAEEVLQTKDFEAMSTHEQTLAKHAIARISTQLQPLRTRRFQPSLNGLINRRRSLQQALKFGRNFLPLMYQQRKLKPPPLVVLADISGSMSEYSRMLLHFVHALQQSHLRCHSFLFGTRLSNISRMLRDRDVDLAVQQVSQQVVDWDGGTRIAYCLQQFNKLWSRRVLSHGSIVLLVSDGLDREDVIRLETQIERLHKSCARLIWLNPLLRYDGFSPQAAGIRAMLPHVDEFRPAHTIRSLLDLAHSLVCAKPHQETQKWQHQLR